MEARESRETESNGIVRLDLPHKPEIEVEFGIPEKEIVRLAHTRKADSLLWVLTQAVSCRGICRGRLCTTCCSTHVAPCSQSAAK